jgi:hypothetical protein
MIGGVAFLATSWVVSASSGTMLESGDRQTARWAAVVSIAFLALGAALVRGA